MIDRNTKRANMMIAAIRDGHALRFWDNGDLLCIVIASSYISPPGKVGEFLPLPIQSSNYFEHDEARAILMDLLKTRGVPEVEWSGLWFEERPGLWSPRRPEALIQAALEASAKPIENVEKWADSLARDLCDEGEQ